MKSEKIVVCGAGIVGLSAALALIKYGYDVRIVAPKHTPSFLQTNMYYPRVYAISEASKAFLFKLGVWEMLPVQRLAPVQAMEIHGDGDGLLQLNAWQATLPQLAWIVEANEIEKILIKKLNDLQVPWLEERYTNYCNGILNLEHGLQIDAALFIGADGPFSLLRANSGIAYQVRPYNETSIITHLTSDYSHQDTAFQWFNIESILALLPMPNTQEGSQVSMVLSICTKYAQSLSMMKYTDQVSSLESMLALITEDRLGKLRIRSQIYSFPLELCYSKMIGPNVALVGDAAHSLHPLAGQGLNLGLGDVEILVRTIISRESYVGIGDSIILKRYWHSRIRSVYSMQFITDKIHNLFLSQLTPLAWLRNTGMRWIDRIPYIKRKIISIASEIN